jgi:N6-L-threonylcarbamoyladenine synthase
MYTLGIETSCDETSCAILKNYHVLSNVTISSLREHKPYGGVVPEIATRAHLMNIDKVLVAAIRESGISLKEIDLIATTYKPGLIGALLVGVNFAKAVSISLHKPLIGINHLHAHLFGPFLNEREKLTLPFLGLVVSGGHTEIYLVKDFDDIAVIGQTLDDACGEVFDKVAKTYGLGFPGGPAIDRIFNEALSEAFQFKCGRSNFDLSFSGIKTALIYKKKELEEKGRLSRLIKIKLLSSFQRVVIETVLRTAIEAAKKFNLNTVVCGGGVIANRYLRRLAQRKEADLRFLLSPFKYTADNAAVVAGLGFYLYNKKRKTSPLGLKC